MDGSELPLVSVITGFYNRGHLLDRTLRSLLNQTYPNLEIIVFDDASSDDTSLRLDAYEQLGDPRLRIIRHSENIGFVAGMIQAIDASRGTFIAVQGSGDSSEPERIEQQARLLCENPDIGVVGCFYRNIVEDKNIVRVRKPDARNADINTFRLGNIFSHGEVMYRRSVYVAAGGYRKEFKFGQDRDLWIRMARITRFSTVREVLYNRYIQFDGASFAPEKAVLQFRYTLICSRLASASRIEEEQVLATLRAQGPTFIVARSDRDFIKKVLRASLRAIIWGNSTQALALSDRQDSRLVRYIVRFASILYSNAFFIPVRRLLEYALGIRAQR